LELLAWRAPDDLAAWGRLSTYSALPGGLWQSILLLWVNLLWLLLAGRSLFVSGFDVLGARLLGLRPGLIEPLSLAVAAATAVAVFQIGGLALALSLLLAPAASARLLTDRYAHQFLWAAGLGILAVLLGYGAAVHLVPWLCGCASLSAAGGICLAAGGLLALCACFGPRRARRET
jgi:manganese/zinc/iron transport system permease protein